MGFCIKILTTIFFNCHKKTHVSKLKMFQAEMVYLFFLYKVAFKNEIVNSGIESIVQYCINKWS